MLHLSQVIFGFYVLTNNSVYTALWRDRLNQLRAKKKNWA
jgi:hypothetical protein